MAYASELSVITKAKDFPFYLERGRKTHTVRRRMSKFVLSKSHKNGDNIT